MSKRIEVNLMAQRLRALDSNKLIFEFDCISGDSAHPTNKGIFHVMWKHKDHVSKSYGVKMHYALFFTQDGKAIHQYHMPGFDMTRILKQKASDWFGSHGCVRLKEPDAKKLFDWAPVRTLVSVT
ncbi:L,D-transpeptidase [Bosea sp. BE125]|uniref:L,D-transpeptidase n=1 Tax=Bosea sp. BE125 TaxID=2817909 RepID=UPI003857540A